MSELVEERVSVLVVGGGYAGLTASLSLARRGVSNTLVDRHHDTSTHPKAFGLTYRTMELLRVFPGVQDALMEHSRVDFAAAAKIAVATSLTDPNAKMIYGGDAESLRFLRDLTPAPYAGIGQAQAERILRRTAQEFGADIRFATELTEWTQDRDGVSATLLDRTTGTQRRLRADYLIAADGHRSPVRQRLGVPVRGRGTLTNSLSIMFDADLGDLLRGREFVLWFLLTPSFHGVFVHPEPGSYLLGVNYPPEQKVDPSGYSDEQCVELVRAGIGIPDLPVKILAKNSFPMGHQVAQRLREGRVFLVGDAAHVIPPTGGLGGNTAIQDGYDIAWRLALVLNHQAGAELLDTYDEERGPIGQLTADQQLTNFAVRMRPDLRAEVDKPVDLASLHMGYRYHSAAILTEPDDDWGLLEDPRRPTGRPGSRAAHVPLERDGVRLSTIDLFGSGFVLLTGADGRPWGDAAETVAARLDVPLRACLVGAETRDVEGAWRERYGVSDAGAVLVRPDGYIAWRSTGPVQEPVRELDRVLRTVLHRPA